MISKKDLFGFETQGQKYDQYRPPYPEDMIQTILGLGKKNNYLDIASGTGQVYFAIQEQLSGYRIAQDINPIPCQVLSQKLQNLDQEKCRVFTCDALKIHEMLQANQINVKFDLITIGQALHWFDFDQLIDYIKENLLEKDGALIVMSYISKDIYLDVEKLEEEEQKVFEGKDLLKNSLNFYEEILNSKIKEFYDFDYDNVVQGYPKYEFVKKFNVVIKQIFVKHRKYKLDEMVNFFRTFSAYNVYKLKFPAQPDVVNELQQKITDRFSELVNEFGLKSKSPPLMQEFSYILIILGD